MWAELLPKAICDQKKASLGTLKRHLTEKQGSSIVLETYGPEKAFSTVDPTDKGMKKVREQYDEALAAEQVEIFDWAILPRSIAKRIGADAALLLSGKMQEFYFVEDAEAFKESPHGAVGNGYVVLLRDIRTVSRDLALRIAQGIDEHWLELNRSSDPTTHHLALDNDGFSYPTAELASPYIEQLLQNFSSLFGRIGTKDVSNDYSERIAKLLGGQD